MAARNAATGEMDSEFWTAALFLLRQLYYCLNLFDAEPFSCSLAMTGYHCL
jgi:hypothetical protein